MSDFPATASDSPATINVQPCSLLPLIPSHMLTGLETMARMKDRHLLKSEMGGIGGLINNLETNKEKGIVGDAADIENRRNIFGTNTQTYPEKDLVNDLYLCAQEAVKDPLVVILLLYILVSLFFAIKDSGIKSLWPGSETQLVEIAAVVIATALLNFWPSMFSSHQVISSCFYPQVDVVRNDARMKISSDDVVVGDIVFLKTGDRVPADGVFIDGHSLQVVNIKNPRERHQLVKIGRNNPTIVSGYMVAAGYSRMVVTAVQERRRLNPMPMKGLRADELKMLASTLAKFGRVFGLITFMWLLFRFSVVEIDVDDHVVGRDKEKADIVKLLIALLAMLATSAIIALTSGLDGLVWAVNLTLAYSMNVLFKDQILIKKPAICHQVASVDWICFNKTGTLTSDDFQVRELWIGSDPVEHVPSCVSIHESVLEFYHQAFGLNSGTDHPHSESRPVESSLTSTEKAIQQWAKQRLGMAEKDQLLESYNILEIDPFAPLSKRSGVWIAKKSDAKIHLHQKGAADVILPMCSGYYNCKGAVNSISEKFRESLNSTVEGMEKRGLRCIAFAHRETSFDELSQFCCQDLTLLALVGFQNPVRDDFIELIQKCQGAGIKLSLLTGDSALTSLAISSGLLSEDDKLKPAGLVVEGEEFRSYTPDERLEKVDRIRILAKATPEDKLLMVQTLIKNGRVVAYLGGGPGDAQALKEANLGICFGTEDRAEILKASSSVLMKEKNVSQVLDVLKWGRAFYNSIETYARFLLIATCVNLMVDFVTILFPGGFTDLFAVSDVISNGELPTPVFQVLWVKLIFTSVAPLSVLIKNPSDDLMSKPPRGPNEPLLNDATQRNIGAQALCQILHLLTIHFMGKSMLKLNPEEKSTALFNTYMLSQIFSLIHAKMYDRKNASQDIQNKKWFWGVVGIITVLQVMMVELWKSISGTARLNSRQWGLCIFMAANSIPTSWLLGNICTVNFPSYYKWKVD